MPQKVFVVNTKYPSGFELDIKVMPGAPLVFPNQENPPVSSVKRLIATGDDACEFVKGSQFHRTSPVSIEWPSEVKCISERDASDADMNAAKTVLKGLQPKPENQ